MDEQQKKERLILDLFAILEADPETPGFAIQKQGHGTSTAVELADKWKCAELLARILIPSLAAKGDHPEGGIACEDNKGFSATANLVSKVARRLGIESPAEDGQAMIPDKE